MKYKLKLDIFEGPLDLLLFLIKKDDIDISDIPIAKITDQYMEYIKMMEMLDLDLDVEDHYGMLRVADVRIHKVNNNPRYTYDKNDNRIPLQEGTKSHLGGTSKKESPKGKMMREHGGQEHGGKEHGGN